MTPYPIFFSVVLVLRNQCNTLETLLVEAGNSLRDKVIDYQLIVVDNASEDDSVALLKRLTGEEGIPNLQVYALIKAVDDDTAACVGIENSLGDYVAVLNPVEDDVNYLVPMIEEAMNGVDVVFAKNKIRQARGKAYQAASTMFNFLYRWLNGIHLAKEAPQFRILSKRVVNFILQYRQPAIAYRLLPATAGFSKKNLEYSALPKGRIRKTLGDSIDHGVRLLVSSTRGPMRVVTTLSFFGAVANVLYSIYVLAVAIFNTHVEPGWISLSLQQSGMFFLISLVLLVLGEYILNMATLSNEGPQYYVGQEFTSAVISRHGRLNIEEGESGASGVATIDS